MNSIKTAKSHIDRLPQVITHNRGCFYEFIKNMCEYIDNSSNAVYQIYNITSSGLQHITHIPHLQKLCELLNVKFKFAVSEGANNDPITYLAALNGIAIARNIDGSKQSVVNLINALYPGPESPEVIDGGINELDSKPMSYTVSIKNTPAANTELLALYMKPQLTGVGEQITFKSSQYFSSMKATTDSVNKTITEHLPYEGLNGGVYDYDNRATQFMPVQPFPYEYPDGEQYGLNEYLNNPPSEGTQNNSTYTGKWVLEVI